MRSNTSISKHSQKNPIADSEKLTSALIGAGLLTYSLVGKKSPLKALAGGYLIYRAISGNHGISDAMKEHLGVDLHPKNITIKTTLTVNKPLAEVYAFWRNLENFPLFMKHLESVTVTGETTSVWKAKVPGGLGTIDWDSTIFLDEVNERIGWRSNDGALIQNAGTVHFKDGGKFGTEIHAIISYHAPVGKLGESVGRLLNPLFEGMVREDVKNFKRYMENGEIPTIEGQASGKNKI